jgi:hypothetical protein
MYPGEIPRPTVDLSVYTDQKVLIAGTPWGSSDALRLLGDTVREFLSISIGDQEATSPFAKLPGLSSVENNLRTAVLIANDKIFQRCNKETYSSSCEAVILHTQNSQVAWVQIGQPHILLLRKDKLFPLQITFDLSVDFRIPTPLPSRLIGLERAWDLEVRSLVLAEEDTLILLARSLIPPAFFNQRISGQTPEKTIDTLFEAAVADDPKSPFWLTLLK